MPLIISIVLAAIIAVSAYFYFNSEAPVTTPDATEITRSPESEATEDETEDEDESNTDEADTESNEQTSSTEQYTASAGYQTPARTQQEIAVTLTLDNDGVVTAADIVYDGTPGYSNANQERFDGAYQNEVVGKPLSDIALSRVGGASLTSGAFNEAVTKIAAEHNS